MKMTLSVIKADVGSIGGHIAPSARLLPMSELEYTGIMEKLTELDGRFVMRA